MESTHPRKPADSRSPLAGAVEEGTKPVPLTSQEKGGRAGPRCLPRGSG